MINIERVAAALIEAGFSSEEVVNVTSKLNTEDNFHIPLFVEESKIEGSSILSLSVLVGSTQNKTDMLESLIQSCTTKILEQALEKEDNSVTKIDIIKDICSSLTTNDVNYLTVSTLADKIDMIISHYAYLQTMKQAFNHD